MNPEQDHESGTKQRRLSGFALLAMLRSAARNETKRPSRSTPTVVRTNPHAEDLVETALALVNDGWSDEEAINQLRLKAAGKTRDLRIAERLLRQGGDAFEVWRANRAWRLLNAAAGVHLSPLTEEESAQMSIVSNFCELTEQEQFQYLAASVPELREMETEISAQASKRADLADIVIKLNKLVGPASLHEDFVLHSNVGLASAQRYLVRLAGFLDESES